MQESPDLYLDDSASPLRPDAVLLLEELQLLLHATDGRLLLVDLVLAVCLCVELPSCTSLQLHRNSPLLLYLSTKVISCFTRMVTVTLDSVSPPHFLVQW